MLVYLLQQDSFYLLLFIYSFSSSYLLTSCAHHLHCGEATDPPPGSVSLIALPPPRFRKTSCQHRHSLKGSLLPLLFRIDVFFPEFTFL